MDNICKFIRTENSLENLNIVNFVYEKSAAFKKSFITSASYSICLVISGSGVLHTLHGEFSLSKGDLFFTFSSKPYYIENTFKLQYMYISFIGLRTPGLLDRLQIKYDKPVYKNFSFLSKRWLEDFASTNENNADLKCEALLLHTLSFICENKNEKIVTAETNNILRIKQYIDLNYTDPNVTLKTIAKKFNYNPKYLSSAFVKLSKISFTKYICNLRINHAKALMESGMTSVTDIASASGFLDAHYFSKTFKKYCDTSPRDYCKKYNNTKKAN